MNVSKAKTATIMNKFTIQQLQQMRESEDRVEFKAGEGGNVSYDGRGKTNPKDRRRCILGYVIALCNEGGGRLVIGMHDNYPHRVTGTRQAQDAIGQLESDIYRDTTIRPEIYELYDEENRRVLVIEVPSRPIGKVFKFEDVPLMRVGEELKPMSDAMYLKILQESEPDFSEKICEGLSLEDLDEEAIRVMKKKYADRWEKPEFNNIPTNQVLKDFMLMDNDGHLNYAALILLAKSEVIYRYLPCDNVVVEYRLYPHMIEYTARAEFREPLFLLVDHVWDYINQPASNPLQHYRDKFARYALPAFNEDVVREAVLNAICHRVMFIQSDIVIKQYPDMLVITNAGGFPVGVDIDNILSVNSMPRSRRISEVLQKTGLVEKSGQGVDRMFAISISEGKPIPDYSLTDEWQVCLRLYGTIQDPALLLLIHDIQHNRSSTEKLSDEIIGNVSSSFWSIIRELYFPQSPYSFAVLSSDILGKIYEIFLSQRLAVVNGQLSIVNKPENEDRDIVTTPNLIVREILRQTMKDNLAHLTDEQILSLKCADIACGSLDNTLETAA